MFVIAIAAKSTHASSHCFADYEETYSIRFSSFFLEVCSGKRSSRISYSRPAGAFRMALFLMLTYVLAIRVSFKDLQIVASSLITEYQLYDHCYIREQKLVERNRADSQSQKL